MRMDANGRKREIPYNWYSMVIYRTSFYNCKHEPIYLGDILKHRETGLEYTVIFDADLAEALENLKTKTREKLTADYAEELKTVERREDGPLSE